MLVMLSVFFAAALAIPAAIWATRPGHQSFKVYLMNLANLFQAIPSLAVIGFASTAFAFIQLGIGWAPTLTALILYAILPIFSNAVTGLNRVEPGVLKAAFGLGMDNQQVLWHIELKLARAAIMAGLRNATVMNTGTAALAAAIGADCLGTLIFQGIATGNQTLLLAGAIPTALLAIFLDTGLGWFNNRLAGELFKQADGVRFE